MEEIKQNDFNLNISRYVSTAKPEPNIDSKAVHQELEAIDKQIVTAREKHNWGWMMCNIKVDTVRTTLA